MKKYHLNPKTGNPGLCKASSGACPFAAEAEHFSSEKRARDAYGVERFKLELPADGFTRASLVAYRETSEEWLTGLTPAERHAVKEYTEISYSEINSALWRGTELHPLTPALDSALTKSTPLESPLYRRPVMRGTKHEVAQQLKKWQKEGSISFKGFTSTSAHPMGLSPLLHRPVKANSWVSTEQAEELDETHSNVIFQLTAARGAPTGAAGRHPQELEYLLPRGLTFEVVAITDTTYSIGQDILTAEPLPTPTVVPVRIVQLVEAL